MFIRLVVCLILLGLIFQFVDFKSGVTSLLGADLRPILAIILLYPVVFGLLAARWKVLLGAQDIVTNFWSLFRFYWIGAFFSNFLPSNVGGDLTRVAFLARGRSLAVVTASVLVERISGVTVLIVLLAASLCFRPQYFDSYLLENILWCGVFVFFLTLLFLFKFYPNVNSVLGANKHHNGKLSRVLLTKLISLINEVMFYKGKVRVVSISLFWSFCYYFLIVFVHSLLVLSLNIDMPLIELLFIVPVINLLSLIPVSINALGLAEGATVFFYSQVGVPPEKALALALLARLLSVSCSLVGGALWFFERSAVDCYRGLK